MARTTKAKAPVSELEQHLARNRKIKQADLAAYLGLENERRVRELFDKGVLTCDRNNIKPSDLDQCRLEYIEHLRAKAARWEQDDKVPADEAKDPDIQLAYYRAEQIELARIKKNKALGELVVRADIVIAVSAIIARAIHVTGCRLCTASSNLDLRLRPAEVPSEE